MVVLGLYPLLNQDMKVYICYENDYVVFSGNIYNCPIGIMEKRVLYIAPLNKNAITIYIEQD